MVKKQTSPLKRRHRLIAATLAGVVALSAMSAVASSAANASVPSSSTVRVSVAAGDQRPMSSMGIRW